MRQQAATDLPQRLDSTGRSLLFTEARTASLFDDTPVTDDELRDVWDLARWSPSAANSQPLRVLFIRTTGSRERLIPHLDEGNREKTSNAPVSAVLAWDENFHEHLPDLFPTKGEAIRARFENQPESRHELARQSAALQTGVFLLAARAVGLATGPMAGFDRNGVDAEFFSGMTWRSHLVVNLGRPSSGPVMPRLPRLAQTHALHWL